MILMVGAGQGEAAHIMGPFIFYFHVVSFPSEQVGNLLSKLLHCNHAHLQHLALLSICVGKDHKGDECGRVIKVDINNNINRINNASSPHDT
jgi:hypothetical protein